MMQSVGTAPKRWFTVALPVPLKNEIREMDPASSATMALEPTNWNLPELTAVNVSVPAPSEVVIGSVATALMDCKNVSMLFKKLALMPGAPPETTCLLLSLSGRAGHFCQPPYIPARTRSWLHPISIDRSLSLDRYGCLQRLCCACLGVIHFSQLGLSPIPERLFDRDYSLKPLVCPRPRRSVTHSTFLSRLAFRAGLLNLQIKHKLC